MSLFDEDGIGALRFSILTPFSQIYGAEISTVTDSDGAAVSNVVVDIPGGDINGIEIEVRDEADRSGGYYGVSVSVGCGDAKDCGERFSDKDVALAFIRERIKQIVDFNKPESASNL